MALSMFTNAAFGSLIFYDRRGAEVYLERGQSKAVDLDTEHPPIKAWLNEGLLLEADSAPAVAAAQDDAARLEAERAANAARVEADPQAEAITIIAGEPRPIP